MDLSNQQYLSSGGAGGADVDGDRSFLTFYKESGAQIFQASTIDGVPVLVPQRTLNQHLVAGQDELAPLAGLNFLQPVSMNNLLKKGYITETNWFVVTSIGVSPVAFGRLLSNASPATVASPNIAPLAAMSSQGLLIDNVVQGINSTNFYSRAVGTLFGDCWRSMASSMSIDFLPSGSKCRNELGDVQSNPSSLTFDSESVSNGIGMFGYRNVLDKGWITNPRNQNGDQTYCNVRFNNDVLGQAGSVVDPLGIALTSVDKFGTYAVIYQLTYGGYCSLPNGKPIDDPKAQMLAEKALRGIAA